MFKLAVLPIIVSSVLGSVPVQASVSTEAPVMQSDIIAFEQSEIPNYIEASDKSKLSLDKSRYVIGEQSLKWEWSKNDALFIRKPIKLITDQEASEAWGRRSTQVLSFWVYNETAVDDYMVIDLGRGLGTTSSGDTGFKVNMNFTGWRSIGVSLQNDIEGRMVEQVGVTDNASGEGMGFSEVMGGARSDMDTIRFVAPSKAASGTFWIDRIMLSVDDARYQWSDDQIKTRYTIPELDFNLPKNLPVATQEEVQSADYIKNSLISVFTTGTSFKGVTLLNIDELRNEYDDLRIKRDENGVISGRHIITGKQQIIYQPNFLKKEDKELMNDYIFLNKYSNIMFNIGRMYNLTDDVELKQELSEKYSMLTAHIIDQGFVDGSSLVTTHHWGYSARWWYISALLMVDTLEADKQRDAIYKSLLWYSREFKDNFEMSQGLDASNLDYFNTLALQHLALLMLEPNQDKRIALLKKFGSFIDYAFSQTPVGGNDGFRPDGTAWRHEGNYPGYSFPAFNHAGQLVYMLSGTPFEVGTAGRKALKNVMMSAWVYANPQVPMNLSGRHPFNPPSVHNFKDGIRWLALTGNAETGAKVDYDLAGAYLQIEGLSAEDSVAIFGERVEPKALPSGNWTFNGGAYGIHRYNDVMVSTKAYNSNVWSSEIYYKDNRYGRYQSHGSVHVVPYGDQAEIGLVQQGWDWNRNPGTTTIHLPLEKLDSPNSHTLMLRGEQPFSGASSLEGQYGSTVFKHKAPSLKNFDGSFKANKTTFSVGDKIVLLGSGISNNTSEYPTETTLFQHAITDKAPSIVVNGGEITKFPYSATLGKGDWLIDGHGTGYLITGDAAVKVERKHQKSKHDKTRANTEGDFSVAVIDHGNAPKNSEYEYLMVLDATKDTMHTLSVALIEGNQKPFEVVRKNNKIHIVKDTETGVTAYTAFEGGVDVKGQLVTNINNPSIIMTRINDKGELVISGTTPDLNMTRYTEAKPITVSATVKGAWESVKGNDKVSVQTNADTTNLTFEIYFGIPQEVVLKKK